MIHKRLLNKLYVIHLWITYDLQKFSSNYASSLSNITSSLTFFFISKVKKLEKMQKLYGVKKLNFLGNKKHFFGKQKNYDKTCI